MSGLEFVVLIAVTSFICGFAVRGLLDSYIERRRDAMRKDGGQ